MRPSLCSTILAAITTLPLAVGCLGSDDADPYANETVKSEDGKSDSSAVALFVNFEFDATVYAGSRFNPRGKIEDQLLFTIGQLNGDNSVGRLDNLVLTDISSDRDGDKTRISYHAVMPVAWGDKQNVPESYTLKLPRDISYAGQQTFTDNYNHSCVESGAHDVDTGSMWYYFRPARRGCALAAEDIYEIEATVTLSSTNTTGKYPEYDKIWEDGELRVVAVFGKYEDGATSGTDAGISAYNQFIRSTKRNLRGMNVVTTPETLPSAPGINAPDVTFEATRANGDRVTVVALLVDNVRTAGAEFNARYGALSSNADLIIYNGHAGLGSNIRALARRGEWKQGQYAIVFMNGCDTYAYVDSALADAHAEVNPDDDIGTRYLDIVTNAMPSFFRSMAGATTVLLRGLMNREEPSTYEQMFRKIDRSEVVLVSGEEDNTYVPGGTDTDPPATDWEGMSESGTQLRGQESRFETPVLSAGAYVFELSGSDDADLYIRIGSAPSTTSYDCRPYKSGSNETCRVELSAPTALHVMVRGYAASSDWNLAGMRE